MAVNIDKGSALAGLSLTPLIDIAFLLLIVFLVATKFSEEEYEMNALLPDASEAKPLTEEPKGIIINVLYLAENKANASIPERRQLRYFVTGKKLTVGQLEQVLRKLHVDNPGRSALIRADKRCLWEFVVAAMNACKKAKIRDYTVTVKKTGE